MTLWSTGAFDKLKDHCSSDDSSQPGPARVRAAVSRETYESVESGATALGRCRARLFLAIALAALAFPSAAVALNGSPTYERQITGGELATTAWPAAGALDTLRAKADCGGVLVSGRWFLTAGHCVGERVDPQSTFVVTLGKPDLDQATAADRYTVDRPVDRHALFAWPEGMAPSHDLALLHLDRPAAQDPLRLVSPSEPALWKPGTSATLVGWGRTCIGCDGVRQLRQVKIPLIDDAACSSLEPNLFKPEVMVCAGEGHRGGCEGDSGGPLMVDRLGEPVLVGTTSGGDAACNLPEHPGLFTRLGAPALNQWLRERIPTVTLSGSPSAPQAGDTVELVAAASAPPTQPGSASYSWDLDGDGAFDDRDGPVVRISSVRQGTYPVRVQAVYPDGDRAVTREVVRVSAAGAQRVAEVAPPQLVGAPRRVRIRSLLDRRISFRVRCFSACSVRATLKLIGRTRRSRASTRAQVGSGHAGTAQAATVRVTVKLTRSGLRQLRRLRRGTLKLRANVTDASRSTRLDQRVALRR